RGSRAQPSMASHQGPGDPMPVARPNIRPQTVLPFIPLSLASRSGPIYEYAGEFIGKLSVGAGGFFDTHCFFPVRSAEKFLAPGSLGKPVQNRSLRYRYMAFVPDHGAA